MNSNITDAISLRAVEPSDVESLYSIEKEGFNDEYGDVPAPLSLEMLRTYALTYDADPFSAGALRLIAEQNGEIVGMVDLYDISAIHQRAEVGIYICRAHRRKGCGTRVLEALERYCVSKLNIITLLARTFSDNKAAINLFESSGYRSVGVLENWQKKRGVTCDINLFQKRTECD